MLNSLSTRVSVFVEKIVLAVIQLYEMYLVLSMSVAQPVYSTQFAELSVFTETIW